MMNQNQRIYLENDFKKKKKKDGTESKVDNFEYLKDNLIKFIEKGNEIFGKSAETEVKSAKTTANSAETTNTTKTEVKPAMLFLKSFNTQIYSK